jgi:Fusaric acid resistance protein family
MWSTQIVKMVVGDGGTEYAPERSQASRRRSGLSPVSDTQSARPPMTIIGFPLSVWGFVFRTWAAIMVALYAASWLQLDNAWSAAVTVSILSMQTRGQTYQRAVY